MKSHTKNTSFFFILKKPIATFETLEFFKFESFMKMYKLLNFGPKVTYLGVLGSVFEKLLLYLKSATSNLSTCKHSSKTKKSSSWNQKCLIWVFSVAILKTNVIFKVSALELVLLENLLRKLKSFNLGPKMPRFDNFWPEFEMSYLKLPSSN